MKNKISMKILSSAVAASLAIFGIDTPIYNSVYCYEPVQQNSGHNNITKSVSYEESTADKILSYAASLCGYYGRPNIFTDYWNAPPCDWCAMFIVYVLENNGIYSGEETYIRTPFVDYAEDATGGYNGFRNWFEARGRFAYRSQNAIPERGDLIIFNEPENYGHGGHIGFVKDVNLSSWSITTIEGNTNNNSVAIKTYSLSNDIILGYCRMNLSHNKPATPVITSPAIQTTAKTTATTTTATSNVTTPVLSTTKVVTSITTTSLPQNSSTNTVNTANYYISSLIGANLRYEACIDNNIQRVIDTNERIFVKSFSNDFAFVEVERTGETGWLHKSVISPVGYNRYTNGCAPTHYVSSDIGCNMRLYASTDAPVITILDTDTLLTVLSYDSSTGFNYVEVTLYNGTILNGYVHSSVILSIL